MSITAGRLTQLRKMKYEDYLKTPEWKKRRRGAVAFAGERCQLCNSDDAPLYVHHRTYENLGAEMMQDLVALCKGCHEKHHGKECQGHIIPLPWDNTWDGIEIIDDKNYQVAAAWFVVGAISAHRSLSPWGVLCSVKKAWGRLGISMEEQWDSAHTTKDTTMDSRAADVECPDCNAAPGKRCVGESGAVLFGWHMSRADIAGRVADGR